MYLKRADIKGFKSFADKIEMDFGSGITVIVGPNGSGKSNIADAVRWVLGEQSAKSLRGSKMEDVIFAGTENRKALGFAEVSLTMDNKDNALPIDYSEVMVTRRVFRSGESEYYLNKTGCRLKDIVELFMDTGVGKEGYSIIGQGRIDEIISSKSEDRRRVFEEAAGIVKYKTRKQEAERKLEKTRENLVRLQDIIDELQKQLDPLHKQSKQAVQYLELKDRLTELEINILVKNIERLSHQKNQLTEKANEYQRLIYEKNNMKSTHDEAFNSVKNRISQLDEELKDTREKLYSRLNLVEKKDGNVKVIKQKMESLEENNNMYLKQISGLKEEIEILDMEKEQKNKEIELLKNTIDEKKKVMEAFQNNFDAIGVHVGENDEKIEQLKSLIIENLNHVSDLKSKANSLKTLNESMYKRKLQIVDEIQGIENQTDTVKSEIKSLENKYEHSGMQYDKYKKKIAVFQKKLNEIKHEDQELREKIETANSKLRPAVSRRQVLEDMEMSYEGYVKSVRGLLQACSSNGKLSGSIVGTVAQLVQAPQELEKAVEIALGYSLQNVVTYSEEDAKGAIEFLKRNKLGRATFLPVTSIKPRSLNNNENKVLNMKGCIGVASKLVKCPGNVRNIIDNLLGRVVIVDNLNNGIAMARAFGYSFKIVTVEGDVLNPGGSISGGSSQGRDSGLLKRKREIALLDKQILEMQKIVKEKGTILNKITVEEGRIVTILDEVKEQILSLNLGKTRISDAIERKTKDLSQYKEKIVRLKEENQQIESDYHDTMSTINQINTEIKDIEKQNRKYQSDVKILQELSNEKKQDRENILQQITSNRVEVARLGQKLEDLKDSLKQTSMSIQKQQQSTLEREKDIELNNNSIQQLKNELDAVTQEIVQLAEENNRDNQEIIKLQQMKTNCQQRLIDKEDTIKKADIEISRLEEEFHKLEVKLTRIETELNNLHDRMWEDYEVTYIEAMDYKKDIGSLNKAKEEAAVLKNEIKSIGNVNINAIEEYKKVKGRYEFLNTQKDDLIEARDSLSEVIAELVDNMKKQFSSQFEIINEKFNQVFAELFGGGKAQLVLMEEGNVLESGIDIVAQPPGKKLQHLSLLSGGEKALTAIALLFAILMVKPTPFCILDEIEAALDDANVDRFSRFLCNLSRDTQFVIITHRKRTMEIADNLYGITMEEKGISKLISVKLEDKVS